jgi:hypothetical protein
MRPVMFGSSDCPACLSQVKILMDHFGNKKGLNIVYYDLKANKAPNFIKKNKEVMMPTWVDTDGKIIRGVITDKKKLNTLITKGKFSFGVPEVGTLAKYGKNFPDYKGFEIPPSFMQDTEKVWGKGDDTLRAGMLGRDMDPSKVNDTVLSNEYFYGPRMAQPAGQLGTMLELNKKCNIVKNGNIGMDTYGMIYNSPNPQTVGPGFGKRKVKKTECVPIKKTIKRKSRFGDELYQQMGPAYAPGYLVNKNTGKNLYNGGIQNNLPRPYKVQNHKIFIGQAPVYNPIKSSDFGKKRKSNTFIGEGTTLTISKGKVKIKN